jgi:hypothetical protein
VLARSKGFYPLHLDINFNRQFQVKKFHALPAKNIRNKRGRIKWQIEGFGAAFAIQRLRTNRGERKTEASRTCPLAIVLSHFGNLISDIRFSAQAKISKISKTRRPPSGGLSYAVMALTTKEILQLLLATIPPTWLIRSGARHPMARNCILMQTYDMAQSRLLKSLPKFPDPELGLGFS